jgi:beta-fructofuranosidase
VDGGDFDYDRAAFKHGELHELDAGFEFYAPQTMHTSDGRRLLVGWMGVPDGEEMLQPTLASGWIHQMTCLRELEFIDGQLYQRPLRELTALRGEAHGWQGNALPLAPMEIALQTAGDDALSLDFGGALTLSATPAVSVWRDAASPATKCTIATGAARCARCGFSSIGRAWRFSSTTARG